MKQMIFLVVLLSLSLVAVTLVSGMYMVQAAPAKQNWCFDVHGSPQCGYGTHKECTQALLITAGASGKCFK